MSTTIPGPRATTAEVPTPDRQDPPRRGRGWAAAGLVAGLTGAAGIQTSMTAGGPAYAPENAGDAAAVVAGLAENTGLLLAFHVLTMVSVVTLVVFAAGLHRRLREHLPAGSLLPAVASSGLALVSVAGLMGTGLNTEFIFGLQDPDLLVLESGDVYGHWIGTVPWLWVGAGLAGIAVAVATLRHSAGPRWLGWVGVVLGGVTLLFGLSPLQYMAGFTGPVWLVVTALGLLVGDRAVRAGR